MAVTVCPDVDWMAFTAVEPAIYSTPGLSGWRLWWRRADGVDMFRHDDLTKSDAWCATLAEAVESATRWARHTHGAQT